jgi:hypothetical protein
MRCRDFERLINEQLDARQDASPDVERALEAHAASCASCRARAAHYGLLRTALAGWGPPPPPPADFAARFLQEFASAEVDGPSRILRLEQRFRPGLGTAAAALAMAAALLLMVWAGARSGWLGMPGGIQSPRPGAAADSRALSSALAEATAATWELARASSAPAARVSLEVLDSPELTATTNALALATATAKAPPAANEPPSASEVLQDVGDRVNDGVSPLSGTARHAFGFLLGPALAPELEAGVGG